MPDREIERWHVIPVGDIKEHECSEECWCEPMLDPEAEGLVYVHHSLDERENYELGVRKAN